MEELECPFCCIASQIVVGYGRLRDGKEIGPALGCGSDLEEGFKKAFAR